MSSDVPVDHMVTVFWNEELKSLCIGCITCGFGTHPPEPITTLSVHMINAIILAHVSGQSGRISTP